MTYENPNRLDTITESLLSALLYPRLFNRYRDMVALGDSERILEVGCGGGAMTRQLAKHGGQGTIITCVDLLEFWIDRAKRRVPPSAGITYIAGDITDVGLPHSDYTLVFIHYMFHDVPSKERHAMASRLAGVMATGGRLFICEPTKASHGMPAEEIDDTFVNAGLKKVEGTPDSVPIMGTMYRAVFKKE